MHELKVMPSLISQFLPMHYENLIYLDTWNKEHLKYVIKTKTRGVFVDYEVAV